MCVRLWKLALEYVCMCVVKVVLWMTSLIYKALFDNITGVKKYSWISEHTCYEQNAFLLFVCRLCILIYHHTERLIFFNNHPMWQCSYVNWYDLPTLIWVILICSIELIVALWHIIFIILNMVCIENITLFYNASIYDSIRGTLGYPITQGQSG